MEYSPAHIENHYHRPGLYEQILAGLQAQGVDLKNVTAGDLAAVDEFHVRGAEVSQELAQDIDLKNATVLDAGCGLGGPCRMLAGKYNRRVTGIDLSREFISTAQKLSALVGLSERTTFLVADVLDLPFEKAAFDVVWTQHVQMNIRDKGTFYREIYRVLKAEGTFIYYDVFSSGRGNIDFPVPWAGDASISFLTEPDELETLLKKTGFRKVQTTDQTAKGLNFFKNLLGRIKKNGPPALGLHLLLGDSAPVKLGNILKGLEEGKLILQSGIFKK